MNAAYYLGRRRRRGAAVGYSDATITDGPTCSASDVSFRVAWESSSPPGTAFQVYLDRRLAWSGPGRSAYFPYPQGPVYVDVVAVAPGDERTDFSASFPALPVRRAIVRWSGGRHLGEAIAGFLIYGSSAPGGPVDYARTLGRVPWSKLGISQDGFGRGGFGRGGFGRSEVRYAWTSGVLAAGTWAFGVRAIDAAGNLGPAAESSYSLASPPSPPRPIAPGVRLAVAVDPTTRVPTLTWLP